MVSFSTSLQKSLDQYGHLLSIEEDLSNGELEKRTFAMLNETVSENLDALARSLDAQITYLKEHPDESLTKLVPRAFRDLVGRALVNIQQEKITPVPEAKLREVGGIYKAAKNRLTGYFDETYAVLDEAADNPLSQRQKHIKALLERYAIRLRAKPLDFIEDQVAEGYIPSQKVDPNLSVVVKALLYKPIFQFLDDFIRANEEPEEIEEEPDFNYDPGDLDLDIEFDEIESKTGSGATMSNSSKDFDPEKYEKYMDRMNTYAYNFGAFFGKMKDDALGYALLDDLNNTEGFFRKLRLHVMQVMGYTPDIPELITKLEEIAVDNYSSFLEPEMANFYLACDALAQLDDYKEPSTRFLDTVNSALADMHNPDNVYCALRVINKMNLDNTTQAGQAIFEKLIDLLKEVPQELYKGLEDDEKKEAMVDTIRLSAVSTLSKYKFFSDEQIQEITKLFNDNQTALYAHTIFLKHANDNQDHHSYVAKIANSMLEFLMQKNFVTPIDEKRAKINGIAIHEIFKTLAGLPLSGDSDNSVIYKLKELDDFLKLWQDEYNTKAKEDTLDLIDHTLPLIINYGMIAVRTMSVKLGEHYDAEEQAIMPLNTEGLQEWLDQRMDQVIDEIGKSDFEKEESISEQIALHMQLTLMGERAIPAMFLQIGENYDHNTLPFVSYHHIASYGEEALDLINIEINGMQDPDQRSSLADILGTMLYKTENLLQNNLYIGDENPHLNSNIATACLAQLPRPGYSDAGYEKLVNSFLEACSLVLDGIQKENPKDKADREREFKNRMRKTFQVSDQQRSIPVLTKLALESSPSKYPHKQAFAEYLLHSLGYTPELAAAA